MLGKIKKGWNGGNLEENEELMKGKWEFLEGFVICAMSENGGNFFRGDLWRWNDGENGWK